MAPYVLTPTVERDNGLSDYEPLPQAIQITIPHLEPEASGISIETSNDNGQTHSEIHGFSHSDTPVTPVENVSSAGNDANPSDSSDTYESQPSGSMSPISFETAYTHGYTDGFKGGYTEGYAKSHTELKHQPIAIIGMSCRFPGNVSTPDEFWELCARARTGFSEIPKERFENDRFFHPNPGKSGTTNARGGNFLQQDLTAFDAPFFSFTAQEATSLDPQQRLLLECTFEAMEGAGIPKHSVVGKNVGCFVGGTFSEYEADLFRDPDTIPMHQATGTSTQELY